MSVNISSRTVAALTAGCASVDTVVLDHGERTPTKEVAVFMHGEKPPKPFKGIREMMWLAGPQDEGKAARMFIDEAKKAGADGIIVASPESKGTQWSGFGGEVKFMYRALAFVYQP